MAFLLTHLPLLVKIKITISELAHLFKQAPAWLIFLIRTLIKKISHALN